MSDPEGEMAPGLAVVTVPAVAEVDPCGLAGAVHAVRQIRLGARAETIAVDIIAAYLAGCPSPPR